WSGALPAKKRLSLAAASVVGWLVHLRRIVWFWKAAFVRPAVWTENASSEKCVLGVVLSGGDFTPGGAYPGNYGYPPNASIDYYASKGMGIIRLPFLWERVQPVRSGPLDATEMSRIDPVVDYAIAQGLKVGIDVHNGGYGYGALIGGPHTSDADFADLWGRLATHYKDRPDVLLMLMSEPSAQSARQWLRSANAAIAAIRAAGATQTIVVPGSYFDGAWTWTVTDNADVVGRGVVDPLNNYMFEVHQYLDRNSSGGSAGIVSPTIGADRLAAATAWARAHGQRFFLGEFGTGRDAASLAALDTMLAYIQHNGDVWAYATWWGAGDRWYDYFMSIEPTDDATEKPQMAVLAKHLATRPVS
ncbi:MAG: glycoside hydrolase family 5 protein, partial [Reyranella sp.]